MKLNLTTRRMIAHSAVRSIARKNKWDLKTLTVQDAFLILDELTTTEPELIASQWYRDASDTQIKKFKKEYRSHSN